MASLNMSIFALTLYQMQHQQLEIKNTIFKYKTRLWLVYLLVSRLSRALKAKHAGNLCSLHHVQGMILNTA